MRKLLLLGCTFTLAAAPLRAENISALGKRPDWKRLDAYQKTITKEDFEALLNGVFAPGNAADGYITVQDTQARIRTGGDSWYTLEFASNAAARKPAPRYWRMPSEVKSNPRKPLAGLHIALDPGHIGGKFAKVEERWFQIGDDRPITEGDMTLLVARHLERQLTSYGAKVSYVRKTPNPVTDLRPEALRKVALVELRKKGINNPPATYPPRWPSRHNTIQGYSELLFYRTAEISARAELVNEKIKPDLVLCIHFNAEDWGDPDKPSLTSVSHLHLLIQGKYGADELKYDDQRFEMMLKLLNGTHQAELMLAKPVAASLARDTGLPPYRYMSGNAAAVAGQPYIWKRNLRANRLYECPVVFLEPYIMNNKMDYARMQMGDYDGEREVGGRPRKSIYREYAEAVTEGLVAAAQQASGR